MLNNREWALLIWLGGVLALFLLRGNLRSILFQLARVALHPVVVVPVLLMAGWVGGLILVTARIGWWEGELATDTAVWFFGTALAVMFNVTAALSEERLLIRTFLRAVKITVLVEVFVNLYVFSLPVELILLPVLTVLLVLSLVAGSDRRLTSVKGPIDTVVALIGFALIVYVLSEVVTGWQDFDRTGALRKFALPVWLSIGIVPFLYLFSLYLAYDGAFKRIDFETDQRCHRWQAKLALALRLRVGVQDIEAFRFYWAKQAAAATSFRHATQVVDDFRASRRADERARAEAQERLIRYAGVDGEDDEGRRLDQREFNETKDALRALATAEMGWYRNRGGHYRPELLVILQSRFEGSGLPSGHGISLQVAQDGQSWWAWRRTVTGWCFAIGAAGPPPDEWLYDGPEPPPGPPGHDAVWGNRWGIDAKNW
jgi:hypothetical protein